MSLFLREKPDGRRAPGYAIYLIAGIAAVAAVVALHRRITSGPEKPSRRPGAPSHVASITQPASAMTRVEIRPQASSRNAPRYRAAHGENPEGAPLRPARPAADPFDPIATVLQASSNGAAETGKAGHQPAPGNERTEGVDELPPAFSTETKRAGAAGSPGDALFGYRDASEDAAPGRPTETASRPPAADGARIPRGSLIKVFLLSYVDTGNPAAVIQFGVAEDFVFNRRCQIPFGTRLLGRLAGQALRSRLDLTADTLLYPDGLEIPISASAVEASDDAAEIRPGLAATFLPPPAWAQIAPYLSDFITGTLGLLETRAQHPFAVGVGGFNLQGSAGGDLRAPLYQSSAQAIQDFTQARLKELEQRGAACYVIPPGTACWLQLEADLDLGATRRERDTGASTP